jgi:serine/threonine-protein kinase
LNGGHDGGSTWAELKRRRVFRAVIGYGVVAFAVLQIVEPIIHGFHWPDDVLTWVVAALAIGFPITVGLAWVFDIRAARIERTVSAGGPRGVRLAVLFLGIGSLAATPLVAWYGLRHRPRPAPHGPPSIAVLPFVDMSPNHDQDYFADGISEEVLDKLTQLDGLRVAGRTSAFSFKGKNEDLRDIGHKLGVANLLEGSVRKAGDHVRITAQLISVDDGYHVWSHTFDRDARDVFAVQEEIAASVATALRAKLLPGPVQPERETPKPEAHDQLLLGNKFLSQLTDQGYGDALEAYRRAAELDPGYAPAWSGQSLALFNLAQSASEEDVPRVKHEALAMAEKAVALAPDDGRALSLRGVIRLRLLGDIGGARQDLDRAIALSPGDETVLQRRAYLLADLGRLREAIALQRSAVEIDRLNGLMWTWLTYFLIASDDLDAAAQAAAKVDEIAPGSAPAVRVRAAVLLARGDAKGLLANAVRANARDGQWMKAIALHQLGQEEASLSATRDYEAAYGRNHANDVASLHALRGDLDAAFEWIDRADHQGSPADSIKFNYAFKPLRNDPRYAALLRKRGLPAD